MKKIITSILISVMCCVSAFSLSKRDFGVSVTPEFGVLHGMLCEYLDVHAPLYGYTHQMSQLNYNVDIPYFGLEIDSKLFKWVYLGGSVTAGFPGASGYCGDYDWQNGVFINYDPYRRDVLTNFSNSDNEIKYYFDARLAIGANLDLPYDISIKPYVSLEYADVYCNVNNLLYVYANPMATIEGNYLYYSIFENAYMGGLIGPVGQYSQYYSDPSGEAAPTIGFGLKFSVQTFSHLDIRGTAGFLPFLSITGYDYHMLREIKFIDISSTFRFYANLSVAYKFDRHHSVGVKGGLSFIKKSEGSLWMNSNDGAYQLIDPSMETGSASQYIYQVSLFYSFSL